ncbi:TonB-dependent hemoglobin/transferrin/lactoferrin family receptor [Histophilus somni]|uniref:TonB-dependent hemoglobin/transferrin/lactoferrin family receptor n=1 Tax=Histophilus somni TaxID=731 RepID=UPI0009D68AC3|nr:TonB-dependent hemoglobin/transferrin/lactoferrin family receptor [Histophilus somni]
MKSKYSIILNQLFLSSSLMFPALSFADSNPAKTKPHKAEELGGISVVANVEPIFSSTQSSEQLRKNMVSNERDLFRHEVGIGVPEGGRSGSNGFAIRGVDKDRVAVIVDGIPQAESTMSTSARYSTERHNGNINNTEYENISSVKVQKGANSVMNGSGALGGAVSFTTKEIEDFVEPDRTFGFLSKTGYTSKNREWRQVIGGGFKTDRFFGFAQLTKRWGHETINNGKGADITGPGRGKPNPLSYHTTSWLTKIGYDINNTHRFTLFLEDRAEKKFTEEKTLGLNDENRFATDRTPYRRYGLEYRYNGLYWLETVKLFVAKQKIEQLSALRGINSYNNNLFQLASYQYIQDQTITRGELSTYPLALWRTTHRLSSKVEFRDQFLENSNSQRYFVSYLMKKNRPNYTEVVPVKSRIFSLSLLDEVALTDTLKATIGGRYDRYNYAPQNVTKTLNGAKINFPSRKLSHLSWQLGLEYQVHPSHQIGYRLSTGFRVPRAEDLYFVSRSESTDIEYIPNPFLQPETALNHELTYRFQNQYAHFSVGLFRTRYHNFIQERERCKPNRFWDPDPKKSYGAKCTHISLAQFVNEPKAVIKGIEVSGAVNGSALGLSDGLTFRLKGSYSKGQNHDGDPLKSIQPWTVVGGIDYETEKWSISLTGRYSAAKKAKDAIETEYTHDKKVVKQWPFLSPSYFVVDLTGQVNLSKNVTLNMGIFNLFNRNYTTWDSAYNLFTRGFTSRSVLKNQPSGLNRFTAPKRNFAASVEVRF